MSKSAKRFVYCSCAALLIFALLPLMGFVFYRDWAFICENTASRKGYRQYWFGLKTQHWYQECIVEDFVRKKYPNELIHHWTSYAGTGKNIFGNKVLHGHGRPGPILQAHVGILNEWFSALGESEKKQFYDLLVAGNKEAIQKQIDSMLDETLEKYSKKELNSLSPE